jgi:2-oxoglutarate ferredoxin oxidoreductase subunit gamma
MEKSFIIAGFGGQGVMVIGQLLCYTAAETTDKYVTYFPSYGAEMRGGTANCYVVISDEPVGAPKVEKADYLVVLNEPSMVKFGNSLVPGGTVFINSSVVTSEPDRVDIASVKVDAGTIAYELGNPKVLNIVTLGTIIGYTDILPEEKVLKTIFKKLGAKRPELNELNEKAFRRGLEIGKAAKNQ